MSEILSVDDDSGGFHVTIKTDIGTISWDFEDGSKCCEEFGVKMSQPPEWLVGKKFFNVTFESTDHSDSAFLNLHLEDEANYRNSPDPYDNVYDEIKSLIACRTKLSRKDLLDLLGTSQTKWTIEFYNHHNGYYSHNLDIIIDGTPKWNLSL